MPVDTTRLADQVKRAFARQERYAGRVSAIYDKYAEQILSLINSYPGLDKSVSFSFSKYPKLKRQVDALLKELSSDVLQTIEAGIEAEWDQSNLINDSLVRSAFGLKAADDDRYRRFFKRNAEALEAFKKRKDPVTGLNLSRKIWNYTGMFRDEMEAVLEASIKEGKSAAEISRDVRKYLQEPDKLFKRVRDAKGKFRLSKAAKLYHPGHGVYRSSFKNAMRLTRTETNMAYKAADFERYQQLDFVVGFEVHLSKSHAVRMPGGDICDDLKGKYPKSFKFTGWHPQCMCYVTSILITESEFASMQSRILNGETTGDIESVNSIDKLPTGFGEWVRGNTERGKVSKHQPFFIRDNFKGGRIENGLKM